MTQLLVSTDGMNSKWTERVFRQVKKIPALSLSTAWQTREMVGSGHLRCFSIEKKRMLNGLGEGFHWLE